MECVSLLCGPESQVRARVCVLFQSSHQLQQVYTIVLSFWWEFNFNRVISSKNFTIEILFSHAIDDQLKLATDFSH